MRTSRKWLSQYMDISDLSIQEIADRITAAGFEVEGIEYTSAGTNLTIGYVETCEMHPDSDHLHCTTVNVGDEVLNIVCGAPNVAAGQKVIVALNGAKLPGGEIKKGVIRGQESNGMICSLLELGVDPKALTDAQKAGIEILPEDAPVGHKDPRAYLGLDDEILEIGLTPNRNDCLSQFNLALEIGAILEKEVKIPEYAGAANIGGATELKISSETEKCPQFIGKVVQSVTIKESPKWMKECLAASGVKSINNVVDISNIVMLETGQPMHFYDIDAIPNMEITVKDGFNEGYTALDGIEYQLLPEDIIITNSGKPIGIGGIMGGDDSKILDTTRGLILESASFSHVQIRNTSRRLSLATEASVHYQKGIEPTAAQKAIDRAIQLLIEYADAQGIEETVKYGDNGYTPVSIECTADAINFRLGTDFSKEEVVSVFERLNFAPEVNGETIVCHMPAHRTDMEGVHDLSEEVIRMIGYDRLPSTLPYMEMTEGKLNPAQRATRLAREFFTSQGLQDCITYTLVSTEKMNNAVLGVKDPIQLATPMSEERRYIRTSILPSLLDVVSYNHARSIKDCNVVEISDVSGTEGAKQHLAFVLSGTLQRSRWTGYTLPSDFYTAKGLIDALFDRLGIAAQRVTYRENTSDVVHFHPYRSAEILIGKQLVGYVGQIHPQYGQDTDCKNVIMAELDMNALLDIKKSKIKFTASSKYPSVSRDLAFVIDRDLPVAKIIDTMTKQGRVNKENIIQSIEVFDVYQGEHVKENEKSVALTLTFQSATHTLKDDEINTVFTNIRAALEKNYNAQLRG